MTRFPEANELLRSGHFEEAADLYRQLVQSSPKFYPYSFNSELAEAQKYGLAPHEYDVVIATDLRFPGGSSSSTLEEINANAKYGLKTGLYHLPAPVMKRKRDYHPGILEAVSDGKCFLIKPGDTQIRANILLFRHPSVLHVTNSNFPVVDAEHVLIIVNHPPSNAVGRIDYILTQVYLRAEKAYGVKPLVYPIGPLIRERIQEFYGEAVPLQEDDWVNIFDVERFSPGASISPRTPLRIGRHSRPAREKWPSSAIELLEAYPESPDIDVRVLGGASIPKSVLGRVPSNWTVYEFGEVPPEVFLKEIDVFVYFHHPDWLEAFGRVLVEAMASGLPIILPPHFSPLIGEAGIYAFPDEVYSKLKELQSPEVYNKYSKLSREAAVNHFSEHTHITRLSNLSDGGRPFGRQFVHIGQVKFVDHPHEL